MNPDRQPTSLQVARVEWVPSSLDSIEVRVFGAWHGGTVPPSVTLLVGSSSVEALPDPPLVERPPAWSAVFVAPSDARALLEAGEAALDVGEGALVALPAAEPGRMDPLGEEEGGVLVDPAVLAERRARRAEMAEESASRRAASAEEAAETLRAQLGHLEERVVRAGAERDKLAARVADAERQLRLAEQRVEAERRRRAELEDEVAEDLRVADTALNELRSRLAGAEEVAHALELELAHARRRQDEAERAASAERDARRRVEAELTEARRRLDAAGSEGDAETFRGQIAELEARLSDQQAHADELARRLEEADLDEVARLRARAADLEARLASADPAEVETLRAKAAIADVQATELDALRAQSAAMAEQSAELDALRDQSAQLERLRAHNAALERRLAEQPSGPSERELVLAERVASLEAELERRIVAQERVTAAITTVRDELATVQAQLDAGRADDATLRAQVTELEARRHALEAAVAERDRELAAARAAVDEHRDLARGAERRTAELLAQLTEERARRTAAEAHAASAGPGRRPDLEARLKDLAADLAVVRDRLTAKTSQLEARLAEERARREAAEARLAGTAMPPPPAPAAPAPEPPSPAHDPFSAAEGDALDALVAGLRAEVAAAREHLDALDPPAPAPARHAEPPLAPPPIEEETRERLQSIEAELRAAVPDPASGVGARDVIASLQHAAERLRAAAQEELARANEIDAPPSIAPAPETPGPAAPPRSGQPASGHAASPASVRVAGEAPPMQVLGVPRPAEPAHRVERLTPRVLGPLSDETPWLRRALERLAQTDPRGAAELFGALLPTQALVVDRLAYDAIVPALGPVRVRIASGAATVEPVESRGEADEVDAVFEGDVAALAPLVAGGAGWLLRGVRVREGRRHVRRLARARRAPVTLADLARSPQPPDPGLVLPALAAAVEPAWTAMQRFSVHYLVDGDGGWRVSADDGAPLAVTHPRGEASATVRVSRGAMYPLIAGLPAPAGARVDVEGDDAAVRRLHAWFDRARGLAS